MSSGFGMEFTITAADPEVLALYFGGARSRPTHSVLIDHVEWVSAEPRKPHIRRGWRRHWDWITGRHRHALRLHAIRRAAWVEAGCPKMPTTIRTFIPRAIIDTARTTERDGGGA